MTQASLRPVVATLAALLVAVSGFAQSQIDGTRRLQTAIDLMNDGRSEQALADLAALANVGPAGNACPTSSDGREAAVRLVLYYVDTLRVTEIPPLRPGERPPRSLDDYLSCLVNKSDSTYAPVGYVIRGRLALMRDRTNLASASSDFARAYGLVPTHPIAAEARFREADAYRLAFQFDKALTAYRGVWAAFPTSPWARQALLGASRCLVKLGRPLDAFEPLQQLREHYGDSPEARTARQWNSIIARLYLRSVDARFRQVRTISGNGFTLKDTETMAVGPDGVLNVAGKKRPLLQFDSATGAQKPVPLVNGVTSLSFDASGQLFLVQNGTARPAVAKPGAALGTGAAWSMSLGKADGVRPLQEIRAVAITSRGERVVADGGPKGLVVVPPAPAGSVTSVVAPSEAHILLTNGWAPDKLAVDADDRIAAFDTDQGIIDFVRPGAGDNPSVGHLPGGGQALDHALDFAFDPLGHLYVLQREQLTVYAPAGNVMQAALSLKPGKGQKLQPVALAVDAAGRVYVYDKQSEKVLVYQ